MLRKSFVLVFIRIRVLWRAQCFWLIGSPGVKKEGLKGRRVEG
jgi:hypothetical protein